MALAALGAAVVAALPVHGTLVPGVSLGGVRLGDSRAQVTTLWGREHGVCRGCARPTWYFTYAKYEPQGAGVEFAGSRVAGIFTLWSPTGWRTAGGLTVGDPEARVRSVYGPLPRSHCGTYDAFVLSRRGVTTAFYVYNGKVWGFGVSSALVSPCR